MKRILILILCFVGFRTFAQVPFEMGAIKVDSLYMNETSNWWSGFSTDATFATPSDKKVPSQKATSTYIAAQIAAITAGVTDTTEVIRLISAYLDTLNFSITAVYDAVGDTILTIYNGSYGYTFSFQGELQDSLDRHTDSIQSHNTRIKAVKTINTTQGDTLTAHNNRLKAIEVIGAGAGTIDTTGLPAANQVAYFTAADKLGGSTNFLFYTDSVVMKKYSNHRDTVFLRYLKGSVNGTRFPVLTNSGGLDSGTLTNASEQLLLKYPSIYSYMKDTKDGELAGYYTQGGNLVKNYGLRNNTTGQSLGLEAIEVLQGHNERNYIFNLRTWIENKWQWVGMLVLLLWVIRLEIKLRKK